MGIEPKGNKRLSNQSKNLLRELERITEKAGTVIPQLYQSLVSDGYSPFEARDIIEERVSISQQYLRRLLPEEARHTEKRNIGHAKLVSHAKNQPRLVTDETPKIPPSPQVVKEAEYETVEVKATPRTITYEKDVYDTDGNKVTVPVEPEPVQRGSIIATLDCKQFHYEVRDALINNQKLKLKINNNVVTAIL